ncbi:PKD domain-containing protein [Methanolobus sediminis]|uniref:PKD domain-containing protein n=1 Tax=Methanolobus sediminis TaxID=3072978 RepID=A0AA51YJD9_9EURY|nr:PKD domain-containing protein [Methanolobus sediminis]WMW25496.1 PKD domain-containing protein [Methanolobus sediminis]
MMRKTKNGMRIITIFAVMMMLISVIPTGAMAASDNAKNNNVKLTENNGNIKSAGDNGNGNLADDSTDDEENAKITGRGNNAASNYNDAKVKFANIKSQNPNLNTEEAINATKDYLNETIDYMISLLDEDSEYIDDLKDVQTKVLEEDETRKDLADSAKTIKNIWNDARKEHATSASKAVDNKINGILQASENLRVRLNNEINTMEENGKNVDDLRDMLGEYEGLIEQARNRYANGNTVEAGKDIKDANGILRNILKELKQEREGVVVLTGNGTLHAEGNGTVVLSGNLTIDITADDYAKLVIKDLAGDADINADDAEYDTSNIDAGNSTDNNRAFVFINITGEVNITGSRLTVMVSGEDIKLDVDGTGTAVLSGEGTYTVGDGDEEGDWASRYTGDDEDNEDATDEDDNVTVVANFTYNIDGLNVTFNDASANASSWYWDFDDGNYSTEQYPTHEYALYDEYNVSLTAYESDNNKLNNDSITQIIMLTDDQNSEENNDDQNVTES